MTLKIIQLYFKNIEKKLSFYLIFVGYVANKYIFGHY